MPPITTVRNRRKSNIAVFNKVEFLNHAVEMFNYLSEQSTVATCARRRPHSARVCRRRRAATAGRSDARAFVRSCVLCGARGRVGGGLECARL